MSSPGRVLTLSHFSANQTHNFTTNIYIFKPTWEDPNLIIIIIIIIIIISLYHFDPIGSQHQQSPHVWRDYFTYVALRPLHYTNSIVFVHIYHETLVPCNVHSDCSASATDVLISFRRQSKQLQRWMPYNVAALTQLVVSCENNCIRPVGRPVTRPLVDDLMHVLNVIREWKL